MLYYSEDTITITITDTTFLYYILYYSTYKHFNVQNVTNIK